MRLLIGADMDGNWWKRPVRLPACKLYPSIVTRYIVRFPAVFYML